MILDMKKKLLLLSINLLVLFFIGSVGALPVLCFVLLNYALTRLLPGQQRKTALVISVIYGMFCLSLFLLPRSHETMEQTLIRPLFYSYVALQCLSYFFEVLFKGQKPLGFIDYFNACLFFPSIQSGPIQFPHYLNGEIQRAHVSWAGAKEGFFLIVNGLFKKRLADAAADALTLISDDPYTSSTTIWLYGLLTLARTYGDFSGYTDMVLGSVRIFGIQMQPNFRLPYLASSLADFWRRWHMSLSHWARIYIFNPLFLQSVRAISASEKIKSHLAALFSIWVTFIFIGFWHDVSWRFFLWANLNAIFVWFSSFRVFPENRFKVLRVLGTLFLVMLFQLIAHSKITVHELDQIFASLFFLSKSHIDYSWGALILSLFLLILPHAFDWLQLERKLSGRLQFLILFIQLLLISVINVTATPFIYGKF